MVADGATEALGWISITIRTLRRRVRDVIGRPTGPVGPRRRLAVGARLPSPMLRRRDLSICGIPTPDLRSRACRLLVPLQRPPLARRARSRRTVTTGPTTHWSKARMTSTSRRTGVPDLLYVLAAFVPALLTSACAPEVTVDGTVQGPDGGPMADAVVELRCPGRASRTGPASTDAAGAFALRPFVGCASFDCAVVVCKPTGEEARCRSVQATPRIPGHFTWFAWSRFQGWRNGP